MLDLKKYTQFNQLADKIKFLEAGFGSGVKPSTSYMAQLQTFKKQYDQLYDELSGHMDLPVNLNDYVHNLIKYLNAKNPNGEKWCYKYTELMHEVTEQEYFYGFHTYHDYKYQVELLNGDKAIAVCTVNRELDYANKELTINLLHDKMHAPFSLRLDEVCDEFDEQTNMDLKKIYLQTYIQGKQKAVGQEMSLIQQRIKELQQENKEKNKQYRNFEKQLNKLGLIDAIQNNIAK